MKNLVLAGLTVLSSLFGSTQSAAQPPATHLVRLFYQERAQLTAWVDQGYDLTEKVTDEYVEAVLGQAEIESFQRQGIRLEVVEPDLQLLAVPSCFEDYAATLAHLQTSVNKYPSLATLQDVGDAWEKTQGRASRDLWAVKITSPQTASPKPQVLFVGLHHAREVATSQSLLRLMDYLLGWYGQDQTVSTLLDTREIWIIPMLNPDGREKVNQGYSWRKNTNNTNGCTSQGSFGTDLNRNYSKAWGQSGASSSPCGETYRGPSSFSEPESQASRDFFNQHNFGVVLSIHSYSEVILYPWGYTTAASPHDAQFRALGQKLSDLTKTSPSDYVYSYGPAGSTLYLVSGGEVDFFYDQGATSFVFEIGQTFYPTCATFETNIWPKNLKPFIYAIQVADAPFGTLPSPLPVNPNDPSIITPTLTPTGIVPTPTVTVTPSVSIIPTVTLMPSPTPPAFDADLNDDGKVNDQDLQILLGDFLKTPPLNNPQTDINGDGLVNGIDVSLLILLWSP